MTTLTIPVRKIRVLIVDDSLFMRAAISKTLANGPFEVVGQAKDGKDALEQIARLQPDVVTMDFNMPGMNGAETVRALMQQRPTPVVMFSAHTRQGAKETFDALAAGAVDFVTKPAGEVSVDLSRIADELIKKLVAAAQSRPRVPAPAAPPVTVSRSSSSIPIRTMTTTASISSPGLLPRLCVIAISTGGPAALSELLPQLPADLRAAIIVVQHMPAGFTGALAERLDAASLVSVAEARAGDRPMAGSVLIAPGDRHLELDDRGLVTLTDGPPVNGCRPAARCHHAVRRASLRPPLARHRDDRHGQGRRRRRPRDQASQRTDSRPGPGELGHPRHAQGRGRRRRHRRDRRPRRHPSLAALRLTPARDAAAASLAFCPLPNGRRRGATTGRMTPRTVVDYRGVTGAGRCGNSLVFID
jgi:two-component system, chemotaxis family, protein-glutamate methylesterase/glutaminase